MLCQRCFLAQQAAELLPSISGLLGGINLPTIPLVNFDLDSIKDPVLEASDQLQGLLAASECWGRRDHRSSNFADFDCFRSQYAEAVSSSHL